MTETNIRPPERIPGASPEIPKPREVAPDSHPETLRPEPSPAEIPQASPVTPIAPVAPAPLPEPTLFVQEVEQVLSEGLEETYRQMDAPTQARFKQVGEQTAHAVAGLLEQTKLQAKKIVELLVAWLRIIPGVNQFFLEQEAKIKADKLLALRREIAKE